MNTWRTYIRVTADCLECGQTVDDNDSGDVDPRDPAARDRATRWARRHAEQNPGHLAVVETTTGRCYRA